MEVPAERPQPHDDLHTRLTALLDQDDWVEEMKEGLKDRSMDPLYLAVMCQADESTIRHLIEADSGQRRAESLIAACKYGAKPGVISAMVEAKPDLARDALALYDPQTGTSKEIYPLVWAMREGPTGKRPSEEDIKSLVRAWPESVAKTLYFPFLDYDAGKDKAWTTPLQQCIAQGYSNDLLEFMLSGLSNNIRGLGVNGLQSTDLKWIPRVLPKVHDEFVLRPSHSQHWDSKACRDVIKLLFQSKRITRLDLYFPASFTLSNGTEESQIEMKDFPRFDLLIKRTRVEELKLNISQLPDYHTAYLSLLDSLPCWSCLRALDVALKDHHVSAFPVISQLLEQGMLEELRMVVSKPRTVLGKRKKPSHESQLPLKQVFDSVATNTTLTSFYFKAVTEDAVEASRRLVIALKENATLEQVVVVKHGWREYNPFLNNGRPNEELLQHYLRLNRCGRAIARDTTTTLMDYVALLGSVEQRLPRERWRTFYVQHGLLREAVSKWAV